MKGSVLLMVNQEYVDPEHTLSDGDELALIPPVSGGSSRRSARWPVRRDRGDAGSPGGRSVRRVAGRRRDRDVHRHCP